MLIRWRQHFLTQAKEIEMSVWATHLGYHVGEESRRKSAHLVRSMTWIWSSWDLHMVFQSTLCVCDECPCLSANQTRSYSGRIWRPMIVGTVSGRWVALFQHLNACCQWRSTCCNFLPVAQAMPIAPNLELNTTQEITTQPCAYQLMDQWHECARITDDFTFWKEKNQNFRRLTLK